MSNVRSAHLRWTGAGDVYEGTAASGVPVVVDSDMERGLSPMEGVLLSVAGCMAIDIRMILEKGRVPIRALEVRADGVRREDAPRYFEEIALHVRLEGPEEEHAQKVQRAVDLSRDKYCSVLHTLRPDLELSIEVETGP